METNDLIKLITAVVIEVIRQMEDAPCSCKQNSSVSVKQQENIGVCIPSKSKRNILTLDDVKAIHQKSPVIVIKPGDILTSLAADYIRDRKLETRYEAD